MTRWRVELQGEAFDLEELPHFFTAPELRVVETGDRIFALESVTLDGIDSAEEADREARRLLPRINGAARLRMRRYHNVTAGPLVELEEDGTVRRHVMVHAASAELRMKSGTVTLVVDGAEPEPPVSGSEESDRWLAAADSERDVADVLAIWSENPRDWKDLYDVLEIILGSGANIVGNRWASRNALSRFTNTAQNARHARRRGHPPKNPMPLPEADAFIREILLAWLTTKA